MSIEDTIGWLTEGECCLVCGKEIASGQKAARIRDGEIFVSLCCPLCVETFQKNPGPFRARMAKIEFYRTLLQESSHPMEGPHCE